MEGRARFETSESAHVYTLRDGGRILVRPLRPTDRDELSARYGELSATSRRLRLGAPPDRLSSHQLDRLLDLDDVNRFAWAAFAIDEPDAPGVGVARYSRHRDDPSVAEAAVTVLDAFQRRGIGEILLRELAETARSNGIAVLTATVMWENRDLLAGLREFGAVIQPAEPGVASVRMELRAVPYLPHRACTEG